MVVEKVSANTPVTSGLNQPKAEEKPVTSPVVKTKDNRKLLTYALGGLAVAGVAGVLIYKAVKGKASEKDIKSFQLGDFAKKFADETIFVDFAKKQEGIITEFDPSKGFWSVANANDGYQCCLVKALEKNKEGKLSEFEFATPVLNINVSNFDDSTSVFRYVMGDNLKLSLKYDSNTGKLIEKGEQESHEVLPFLYKRMETFVEDLDFKKLLSDNEYRDNYFKKLFNAVDESITEAGITGVAKNTGKTFDEVKTISLSDEYMNFFRTYKTLGFYSEKFGLENTAYASDIFGEMSGETCGLLETFIKNQDTKSLTMSSNYVEDGFGIVPKKICTTIKNNSDEVVRFSDDGEYFFYERGCNALDGMNFIHLRNYRNSEQTAAFSEIITDKGGIRLTSQADEEPIIELLGEAKDKFEPIQEKIGEVMQYILH